MTSAPRFLPAGDAAFIVEFGNSVDRAVSDRVLALAPVARSLEGVLVAVPTFRSLLVQYDPLHTSARALEETIRAKLDHAQVVRGSPRRWRLPACYEPALGPDLEDVAKRTNLSIADVIRLHSGTEFHVYVVGFAPGFGFLGDLPKELHLPRRTDPRVRVPAGSVAIAQGLTAVYPQESPGGWHLIASCPVRFFDLGLEEPSLFATGDKVRFEPVAESEYERIKAAVARGDYRPVPETVGR